MNEEHNQQLTEIISHSIEQQAGLDFADFMAQCLYHPEHGYYMVDRVRVGKQGDFFTSSSVHALFGVLISRQLAQMWELLGKDDFVIIEQGAGDGHLAKDILDSLQAREPGFYARLTYCLVEVSPDNRRRQQELLREHADVVTWSTFDELTPFVGCFLSNELVDAMPVHVVEKRGGVLHEVFVIKDTDGFGEELRPDAGRLRRYFDWLGHSPCEGNRGEANLAAIEWMRRVADLIEKGFVLTVDYGYPAAELYAPFRRNGTVMCYHRHSTNENPYQRVGHQDITTHVDFSALQKAGAETELDTLYFGEQYRFLMALGFLEELVQLQARTTDLREAAAQRMTLKNLIMPDEGMGSTFKVLVQGKKVGQPELLCQKRIAEIPVPTF